MPTTRPRRERFIATFPEAEREISIRRALRVLGLGAFTDYAIDFVVADLIDDERRRQSRNAENRAINARRLAEVEAAEPTRQVA